MPGSAWPAASPSQQTAYMDVTLGVHILILSLFQKKKRFKSHSAYWNLNVCVDAWQSLA